MIYLFFLMPNSLYTGQLRMVPVMSRYILTAQNISTIQSAGGVNTKPLNINRANPLIRRILLSLVLRFILFPC